MSPDSSTAHPGRLKILRESDMPACCILCGEAAEKSLVFVFSKATSASLLSGLGSSHDQIRWSKLFPLCTSHWNRAERNRRSAKPFKIAEIAALVGGGLTLGWNPYVGVPLLVASAGLLFITPPEQPKLRQFQLSPEFVVLNGVPDRFIEEFARANDGTRWSESLEKEPSPDAAMPDNPFGIEDPWRS